MISSFIAILIISAIVCHRSSSHKISNQKKNLQDDQSDKMKSNLNIFVDKIDLVL